MQGVDNYKRFLGFLEPRRKRRRSTIGERCVFKTSNQAFALYRIERGICEYRKHCASLEFNIFLDKEKDYKYDLGSPIERVFRDKEPESFYNGLLNFVPKKYGYAPCSLLLLVFKPPSRCCSGVLEVIGSNCPGYFDSGIRNVAKVMFKEANFINPPSLELQESTEIEEIYKALQVVCTTHQLPLAQIWIPCCTGTAMAYVDSPGERCHSPYLSCSSKSSISQNGDADFYDSIHNFNIDCQDHDIWTGRGIVGKALLYQKPCFCWDVDQLVQSNYLIYDCEMFPYNEIFNELSGCCAILLHSTRTNHDYVLVFLFPPWKAFRRVPLTCLAWLLATVKKQLPGFKISSVGEESCVEVNEISVNDVGFCSVIPHCFSVKPVPESFANEKETVQDEVVRETVIDNGSNNLGLEQNGASEREYRTTDITLSREDLTKHFGKKLDDAAKILNVSRSTMKRALRHHKINKWPLPKRKKVVRSDNEGIEGTYKGDPLCSDSPPMPGPAGISHKTSNSRQEHDVGNVTIKVTHGNDTFRFKLPFLSRKADLMEKVKTRVSLNEGSFNIKYQDEENEWISIACDDDLGECIDIWQGKSKIIKMLVEPITNQAP